MISDNKINGLGGGSLVEKRNYLGILNALKGTDFDLKVISPDEELEHLQKHFVVEKTKSMDMKARLRGHSTFYFMQFDKIKEYIDLYKPDVLFLGRSRLGFVAKYAKKKYPEMRVISCMENIEYDYVNGYFANQGFLKRLLLSFLEKRCVKKDEKDAIKFADYILFLSKRDISMANRLYMKVFKEKEVFICPICLESTTDLTIFSNKKTLVFVGSLNYNSNVDAVTSFINDIWIPNFSTKKDLEFIVAGKEPSDDLLSLVNSIGNCRVIENFKSVDAFIPKSSLIIAPIKKGAGMKTKIAECLSMGLPAIGSTEAFVGYDQALENDQIKSLFICDNNEETVNSINCYMNMSEKELGEIKKQNQEIFRNCYSYKKAFSVFGDLFSKIITNEK